MNPRPVEIIGGGLAGLSLGLALRHAGVPVTVFEAGSYPRHCVCGEFITGLDPDTIDRLGLAPVLHDALLHREVGWFRGGRRVAVYRLPRPALGISRYTLDARLAEAFVAAGGDLRVRTRVTVAKPGPGQVVATGRRAGVPRWIGLKVHICDLALTSDLEVHLGRNAYVGLSRVEDGAVNVCGLFRHRPGLAPGGGRTGLPDGPESGSAGRTARGSYPLFLSYLRASGLETVAARLSAADPDPESPCAVAALDYARRESRTDGVWLGDRWSLIPPFTGNGMAMAFQSAALAADPLVRYAQGALSWPETCRSVSVALRGRFRLRLSSAAMVHGFLLGPTRQRWLAALCSGRLLPFRPLYAALH